MVVAAVVPGAAGEPAWVVVDRSEAVVAPAGSAARWWAAAVPLRQRVAAVALPGPSREVKCRKTDRRTRTRELWFGGSSASCCTPLGMAYLGPSYRHR